MNANTRQLVGRLTLAIFVGVTLCGELMHHHCAHGPHVHQAGHVHHTHADGHDHDHAHPVAVDSADHEGISTPDTHVAAHDDCAICATLAVGFLNTSPAATMLRAETGFATLYRLSVDSDADHGPQRTRAPPISLS